MAQQEAEEQVEAEQAEGYGENEEYDDGLAPASGALAACPGCAAVLQLPSAGSISRARCGRCGHTLPAEPGLLVRCPHGGCGAVLQYTQGALAARCGACSHMIRLTDLEPAIRSPLAETAGPAGQKPEAVMCPECSSWVIPPAGTALASCGSCDSVRANALLARYCAEPC